MRSTRVPTCLLFSIALMCASAAVGQAPPGDRGPDGPPPFGPDGPQFGPPPFGPPGGMGGPGGPMGVERKILKQFDKDGNGRLEGAERDAARAELRKAPQRGGRGGGRRMPGGPGGPGGPGEPGGPGFPGAPDGPGGPRNEPKPGPKVAPADVANFPNAPLFAPGVVRTVFLEFDVPNWEEELELFHNTDAEVPATMTVDGRRYEGVGVHFRGASSYMMVPRGSKRSFNIAVDHTDGDARLHGQNTLNLLNANGDASMMSSVLYAHLAAPHIPAPRANFVQVVVNGESWGVFVNVEQFNKAFLRERWPEFKGEGARWKVAGSPRGDGGLDYRGEDLEAYRARFEIKSKDREEDWAALVDLCEKLSTVPAERLEETLRPILDIEGVLWFLALDVATANSDGYWTRASDYSIYRDPKGVFHLVPHDMNEAFKQSRGGPGGARGGTMADLDPLTGMDDLTKPLRSRLLAVPSLRERYLAMVRQLGAEMSWERMGPVVAAQRAAIAEFVRKDTRKPFTTEAWERDTSPEPLGSLRAFFERRSKYLASYEDPRIREAPAEER